MGSLCCTPVGKMGRSPRCSGLLGLRADSGWLVQRFGVQKPTGISKQPVRGQWRVCGGLAQEGQGGLGRTPGLHVGWDCEGQAPHGRGPGCCPSGSVGLGQGLWRTPR